MFITLTFEAFSCGTNFGELGAFAYVVQFKILALDGILMLGVWVLGLLNCEEDEVLNALDFESKFLVL